MRIVSASQRALAFAAFAAASAACAAAPVASFSRTSVVFGYQPQGVASPTQAVFLTNTGDAPLDILALAIAGPQAGDYAVGGTCTPGTAVAAGDRCRLEIVMTPLTAKGRSSVATLGVTTGASPNVTAIALGGTVDPVLTSRIFVVTPSWLDFAAQPVGTVSASMDLVIENASGLTFQIGQFALVGGNSADFTLTSNCAAGQTFARQQSCTATVTFDPQSSGPRATELSAMFTYSGVDGLYRYSLSGVGAPTGAPVPVVVVEYYNASLDHYFITWVPAEIAILDAGVQIRGWTRTGRTFNTYSTSVVGTSPVCRFYIPPAYGDSHFFGRGQQECDETASKFPQFTNEDGHFMYVFLPVAGVCPAGTVAVHRAFSNRADANHRYFTDPAIGAQMAAQHWLLEGDGPDLVVMCAV